jgi:hypothetical protein
VPTVSHQRSESGRRTVGSFCTGVWSNARPPRAFHWSLTLYVAPSANFHVSSQLSSTAASAGGELELKRSSGMLDQPVYWRSPITSHRLFTWNSAEKFAICGIVMSDVTLRPYSAWLLTPADSAAIVPASTGDVPGGSATVGLSTIDVALHVVLDLGPVARAQAHLRCHVHARPTFQPHAQSLPVIDAFESSPGVTPAMALNVGLPGVMPLAAAAESSAPE